MLKLFLLLLLTQRAVSIKFGYVMTPEKTVCFQEWVQTNSRYHIEVRGNSSEYTLRIEQQQTTTFNLNQNVISGQLKQYSAYATNDTALLICLSNKSPTTIVTAVSIYHGLHLQQSVQMNEGFFQMMERIQGLLALIAHNYQTYKDAIHFRRGMNQGISMIISLTLIIITSTSMGCMIYAAHLILRYMQYRKIL